MARYLSQGADMGTRTREDVFCSSDPDGHLGPWAAGLAFPARMRVLAAMTGNASVRLLEGATRKGTPGGSSMPMVRHSEQTNTNLLTVRN